MELEMDMHVGTARVFLREPDEDTAGRQVVEDARNLGTIGKGDFDREIDNFTEPATQLLLFKIVRMAKDKLPGFAIHYLHIRRIDRVLRTGPADADLLAHVRLPRAKAVIVGDLPVLFATRKYFGMLEFCPAI